MASKPQSSRYWLALLCVLVLFGLLYIKFSWNRSDRLGDNEAAGGRPEYQQFFQENFEKVIRNCPEPVPENIHSRNVREFITAAYCARRMHQLTREAKHLEMTRGYFQAVLRAWEHDPAVMEKHLNPFFVLELFFQVEDFLTKHQSLSAQDRHTIREYVDQINPKQTKEDNQDLASAVGLTHLMKHYPSHRNHPRWKASVEETWERWYSYKHNIENATIYTAIGWNAVFAMARNLGRQAEMKDPAIRQIFQQHQHLVTPAGALPNWGDSYFGKSWSYWVLLFENAARQYQDPSFAHAAGRVFWWGVHNQPVTAHDAEEKNFDELVRLKPLADLIGWDQQSQPSLATKPTATAVRLWQRPINSEQARHDKLILTTGGAQPEHYLMMDLFATGYHAHHNRRGAVLYYESQGAPLFHSLDRHNKSLEDANSFVVVPTEYRETFPSNHRQRASRWVTERIPLRLLADRLGDGPQDDHIELKRIVLRFSAKQPNHGVLFDNLRLVGPAGTRLLDDASDNKRWQGNYQVRTMDDGNHCMAIGGAARVEFVSTSDWFAPKVRLAGYTHLAYDWKDLSPEQRNRLLCRVYLDHRLEHFDLDARNHHACPEIVRCSTERKAGNAWATIELSHYGVQESRLIRRVVLLPSGALILMDRFYLPPGSSPQLAGPVWNYHQEEVEQHGNWFINSEPERTWYQATEKHTPIEPRRLLVWFPPKQGRISRINRRLHFGSVATVFSQEELQPGNWTTAFCIAYPIGPGQNAATVAKSLQLKSDGERYWLKLLDEDNKEQTIDFDL